MVIKYSGEDHFRSTYSSLYAKDPKRRDGPVDLRHQPTQLLTPVLKHGDRQMVECRTHADYIGKKKYARPIGLAHDNPICLGLGCFTDAPLESAHKEIVSCPAPADSRFKRAKSKVASPMSVSSAKDLLRSEEDLDEMIARLRWIPSTRRQQEEGCIPVPKWKIPNTTWEKNADLVRHRPRRYHRSVGIGQEVPSYWDRVQMRAPLSKRDSAYSPCEHRKTAQVSRTTTDEISRDLDVIAQYRQNAPYIIADQSRLRKLPGYGGFVPREPVERLKFVSREETFQSSSSTYRNYPGYSVDGVHSRGPLSKMVTLVYPYNPFKRTPSTMQTRIDPLH